MQFGEAKVPDFLRASQRDLGFVNELKESIQQIFKLLRISSRHGLQRTTPELATAWYYYLTSLSNIQTLGEEYTGTIRVNEENRIPSRLVQLLWLSLYIGGEPLYDQLINTLYKKIQMSSELTEESKNFFINVLKFMIENKQTFQKLHHCLFYIECKYYNISNRFTGIKYILVRQWMEDDTFSKTFKVLGYLSLFYSISNMIQKLWTAKESGSISEDPVFPSTSGLSSKSCVLCAENRKNTSATPCGHLFCWGCIYDSLQYQQTCPICRESITSNRIIFLQNYA